MAYLLIEPKCFTFFKLKNKNLADTKNMTLRVPYFVKYTCILGDILYNMVVYIYMHDLRYFSTFTMSIWYWYLRNKSKNKEIYLDLKCNFNHISSICNQYLLGFSW